VTPIPQSLQELLAAALAKKHQAIRDRLGIPAELQIENLQLEGLSYHLSERSGPVEILLKGDTLFVREPGSSSAGIPYRGDAVRFLLQSWRVTPQQALDGCQFEVREGKRVT
jgi:hypothetical protein